MALTDHIYDQRLHLRRPPVPVKAIHHIFRVRLAGGAEHVVSAARAEDANLHVKRRNPGKRIVSTFVDGGKE
ncbi:hypothetical protein [Shinella zoogloeoides]|uniref:hypothetical protein n=1 Tax=Shinella zoogloeoides TaxID=352475 RepID=UPI00273DAAC9|nr:hypothetical protein [Shinella zoogloeoides]WLR92156.1 hypothetical protein Q9316_17065 [Shinella zoogloeoides]